MAKSSSKKNSSNEEATEKPSSKQPTAIKQDEPKKNGHHIGHGEFILALLVVTVLIAGLILLYINNNKAVPFEDTVFESKSLTAEGNYADAEQLWIDRADSSDNLVQLESYIELGALYMEQGEFESAIEAYMKAEEFIDEVDGATLVVYKSIAAAAELSGDTETQKKYVVLILGNLNPEDRLYEAEKNGYEAILEQLQ